MVRQHYAKHVNGQPFFVGRFAFGFGAGQYVLQYQVQLFGSIKRQLAAGLQVGSKKVSFTQRGHLAAVAAQITGQGSVSRVTGDVGRVLQKGIYFVEIILIHFLYNSAAVLVCVHHLLKEAVEVIGRFG